MLTKGVTFVLCILFVSAGSLRAQTAQEASEKSCLQFTRGFYSWYVKIALRAYDHRNAPDPVLTALNYKGHHFSRELMLGLKQARAEEAESGDAVLDADPFLMTQDAAHHYVVRRVTEKGGHYFADVYGLYPGPHPELGTGPQVVAELIFKDGSWIFVNFHYPHTGPGAENLLSLLNYQYPGTQPNKK